MEIRKYNRSSLMNFVNSEEFRSMNKVPISTQRAVSQVNNPKAAENDVLLVVAFDENRMTGYLGVLPDHIILNSGIKRGGWLSCYWVDESCRSSNVAGALFLEVMEAWNRNIMVTNFVPSLLPLYQKSGVFQKEMILEGIRGYMRLNLGEILPVKNKFFLRLKPFLKITDFAFNLIADLRFFSQSVRAHRSLYEYRDRLDNDLENFIDYPDNNLCRRGLSDLNWILTYPWILEQDPKGESGKYYFSSVSKRFFYRIICVKNKSGLVEGFFIICVRDKNMTVPYLFSKDSELVTGILITQMLELRCNMITVFHRRLALSLTRLRWPFLYKKRIIRPYLFSKNFGLVDKPLFQDGDGDCAFY